MAETAKTIRKKPTGTKEVIVSSLNVGLTQRQADYLLCASLLKLNAQDLIRKALDQWIDEQMEKAKVWPTANKSLDV